MYTARLVTHYFCHPSPSFAPPALSTSLAPRYRPFLCTLHEVCNYQLSFSSAANFVVSSLVTLRSKCLGQCKSVRILATRASRKADRKCEADMLETQVNSTCTSGPHHAVRRCSIFGAEINLLRTKHDLLYIRNQSVPRSKHFPPRL